MSEVVSAGAISHPRVAARRRMLPAYWPLLPFPFALVLWLLGMSYFAWPVVGVFLMVGLFARGRVMVPPRFGVWLLFLGFVAASSIMLDSTDRAMAYGYRASMYFSATMLFLYLYNTSRRELPVSTIVNLLAIGWAMIVLGGLLGIFLPGVSLTSPMELFLPSNLTNIPLVRDMVSPAFAKEEAFVGLGIHRTQAPFPYPNAWGSNFVLLTPFALWSFLQTARRAWRPVLGLLLVAAIVPFFFSLDRGAWLALAVVLVYGGIRLAVSLDLRTVKWFALGAILLVFVLVLTPLGEALLTRLDRNYSDQGRIGRNVVAVQLASERPLLGYGAPQEAQNNPGNAAVGTHGQLWLILVSNGVPALILYLAWMFWLLVRSGRGLKTARDVRFWPHLVILAALIMSPYYELLPMQLHTIMVAAAIITRDGLGRSPARRGPARASAEATV